MSDCIDDRIEGNFVFLAVRATDGSGRRAGVDLPMDPDELARFEGEQGLMAPSDYRIDGYSKDGIVGRRVAFGSARRRQGRGLGRMLGGGRSAGPRGRRGAFRGRPDEHGRDGGGIRTGPMSGKGEWVNLRFPNAFAHPFSFQGRDGGTRERMLVTIPKGVVLGDGRDVGGWNLSVRATPWALAQKRAGRPVSIGLRVGRSVELFKGRGPRRVTLRLDGPEGLRSALDEHRNVMSARVAVPANPGRGCRGSLDDAAPPMDGPAGDEGMLLFNDLAFDSGFVARMDTLASRFADDFAHGRYDAGTALRETRSLVAEAAMLMETVTGASYGAGAADCAASLALSAVTDAVNGYVDDLVDRNDCDPRVAAANHAERSADPHARPGTLPCLRMFTTAYGKTDETDVFGDGAPVEGMESSSMQLTR